MNKEQKKLISARLDEINQRINEIADKEIPQYLQYIEDFKAERDALRAEKLSIKEGIE